MADNVKILNRFDEPIIEPTNAGSRIEPVFELKHDDKGDIELVKTGETNIYEKIQQYADECDISQILAKAVIDPTILNQREGFYADMTEMPKTLGEAQNMILSMQKEFDTLPVETRAKFDYSMEKYVAQFGSKEWADAMGYTQEIAQDIKETTKGTEPIITKGEEVNES